jgi:hypothetical protein
MKNETEKVNPINKTMTLQEIETLYFNSDAIKETPYIIRRLDRYGYRYYFTVTEDNKMDNIYTSVTTFCRQVLPTNEFLLDWMKTKSKEEQESILRDSAHYGTLMDILFNKMLIDKEIKDIAKEVYMYIMTNTLYSVNIDKWTELITKDLIAFVQWVQDYDVKPILVSCPLKSDKLGIAGTLDLFCEMNHKIPTKTDLKSKDFELKRVNCIVDYKAKIGDFSGKSDRNSFYKSECLQLHIYGELLQENFPDLYIHDYINLSPKNWRTNPGYNMKSWFSTQDYSSIIYNFEFYHKIFEQDNEGKERNVNVYNNSISIDEDLTNAYESLSVTDFINKNLQEEEAL